MLKIKKILFSVFISLCLIVLGAFYIIIDEDRCMLSISKVYNARGMVKTYKSAIELYKAKNGVFPNNLEYLSPLFIKNVKLIDPWNNLYIYNIKNNNYFEIYSLGIDGSKGGVGINEDIYPYSNLSKISNGIPKLLWGCNA